jgi:hypothetical protein
MRWKEKEFVDPRTVTQYLWLPLCIEGEWRWLEWATWEEKTTYNGTWERVRWVDEDEDNANWVADVGEDIKRLVEHLVECARTYETDKAIDTLNDLFDAQKALCVAIIAKDNEIERLKRLLSIERDDEGDEG